MFDRELKVIVILLLCCLVAEMQAQTDTTINTVTDIDGNTYRTVVIGTQTWMVGNLKTTRYRNGDSICTTNPATLDINPEVEPKYQWSYNGDESNVSTYGRLYTWYAVTDSRNVCPTGWHLPTDEEWTTLTTFLGGESVAGGKIKETGITHWPSSNTEATNESGFTALPSGYRDLNGEFSFIHSFGYWWSSTESTTIYAQLRFVYSSFSNVYNGGSYKQNGFSVRCLQD